MAEGALLLLIIEKIAGALAEEAVKWTASSDAEVGLLSQIRSKMFQIKAEFEVIQAFMNYTDAWKKDNHAVLEAWLKQVRELAFEAEDTMDEYTHLLGKGDSDKPGWLELCKGRALHRRNIHRWRGIANHVNEILNRLQHLRDMKVGYGIDTSRPASDDSAVSISTIERRQNMAEDAHFIDNDEDDRGTLVQLVLKDEKEKKSTLTIISVWGMAGLGKTTLVDKVYHDTKGHFSCHAWVTVSQTYRVDDLLRKIKKELLLKGKEGPAWEGTDDTNMDPRVLAATVRDILNNQRYLIVLDDVWSPNVWSKIRSALDPKGEGKCRSRVILTTRDRNVASLADEEYMIELKPLSEAKALELLSVKAFPRVGPKEREQKLLSVKVVAAKIVQKCGRLPLAIVSLGSLLSLRERKESESEWEKVLQGLDWELNNNPELDQLKSALLLSYRDLPNYLKHCFLYCIVFPQEYCMRRKRLIRLWVAEGFIQRRGKRTLEDVAEDILNALVHRCMLQAGRNDSGRVKSFQMHDMMRELVLSLSEREGLCHVYEHSQTTKLQGKVRRLSVHSCGEENQIRNVSMSHIRSLLLFKPAKVRFNGSFKLLRVLDLQGCSSSLKRLPDAVWDLFNLHYLSLRNTELNTISSSLNRLIYLQTLDLAFTKIRKLPSGLSELTHLRNLFVHTIIDPTSKTYNYFSGFPAPKGIWNLENLHTLQGVEANRKFVKHLDNMVQLRSFRIIKVMTTHHEKLCSALEKMQNLQRLDIVAASEEEKDELVLGSLSTPPPRLQKLTLRGRLGGGLLPVWFSSLTNLTWLRLGWSGLTQSHDPLPTLQDLPNLVFLLLLTAYDGTHLCFEGGFGKLRDLRLVDMKKLQHIHIGGGALQSLRQLHLVRCQELKELPVGLGPLPKWEALFLEDMPEPLSFGVLEEDRRIRRLDSKKVPPTDGKWLGQREPSSSSIRGHPPEKERDTEGQEATTSRLDKSDEFPEVSSNSPSSQVM